jgi:hypothetical protein
MLVTIKISQITNVAFKKVFQDLNRISKNRISNKKPTVAF